MRNSAPHWSLTSSDPILTPTLPPPTPVKVTFTDFHPNGVPEYAMQQVTYVSPGNRQNVTYATPGGMTMQQPGMVHQGMQMNGGGGGYVSAPGEPSMRDSVEGIPQIHLQQQQVGGVPGMPVGVAMPTQQSMPTQFVQQHQAYAIQPGATAPPGAQAYPGGAIQYYPGVVHTSVAPGFPHLATATHVADYRFGATPQFVIDPAWHGGSEWEDEFEDTGGAVHYGNLEVKHRRRTTPEQLRVLEHWFNINPRPDNALREWLASELGITKRNVQVWFQNRRAKIKNQEKAREAAAAEAAKKEEAKNGSTAPATTTDDGSSKSATGASEQQQTPVATDATPAQQAAPQSTLPVPQSAQNSGTTHSAPASTPVTVPGTTPQRPSSSGSGVGPKVAPLLLPTADKFDMGRRVSLAGGDVATIEHWAIKRRQQLGHTPAVLSPVSSGNSPMGLAAAARRNSQPYPSQVITHHEDPSAASRTAQPSPKVSPNGRMPSGLLFTAMRNNTLRRASMPGGAQLISTTAFTPPRVANYVHSSSTTPTPQGQRPMARELSPIKDQDAEIDPTLRNHAPSTYVTPPSSAYSSEASFLTVPSMDQSLQNSLNPGLPFSPNSPLPNPSFSFGAAPSAPSDSMVSQNMDKHDSQQALWMALQRGRLGSIASVNSVGTTVTDSGTTEGGSDVEWPPFIPPGFDPDIRRASAPADLLHNIGLLGISGGANGNGNGGGSFIRPSPLATYPEAQSASEMDRVNSYEMTFPSFNSHNSGPLSAPVNSSTPTLAGGPYLPAPDGSPGNTSGSAAPSDGPSPGAAHAQMTHHALMPPPPLPTMRQQSQQGYTLPNSSSGQYSASNASLPPSLPSLPEPTPSAFASFSDSANSSSDAFDPSHFDLGFDLQDASGDDKDQFTFFAELAEQTSSSDAVNVLV